MVIFHSYVSLPEGKISKTMGTYFWYWKNSKNKCMIFFKCNNDNIILKKLIWYLTHMYLWMDKHTNMNVCMCACLLLWICTWFYVHMVSCTYECMQIAPTSSHSKQWGIVGCRIWIDNLYVAKNSRWLPFTICKAPLHFYGKVHWKAPVCAGCFRTFSI